MTNDGQLGEVIGSQAMSQLDEVEYLLRRKLAESDGSVRSTSASITAWIRARGVLIWRSRDRA